MKYLFKLVFLLYIIIHFILIGNVNFPGIVVLLFILAVNILKEKYFDSKYLTFVYFMLILLGSAIEKSFVLLLCVAIYDFIFEEIYLAAVIGLACLIYLLKADSNLLDYLLIACLSGIMAQVFKKLRNKTQNYKISLDKERRIRYELEHVKARLLSSTAETARLTEVRERNRIARDIHDNIGHKIAGILIQLQAADKLQNINPEKSTEIIRNSISELSNSLTILRDTVHRLKPNENIGVDYIKQIIENFKFCPVDFQFSGDFESIKVSHIEIIATNIKEALTNASKYSEATKIDIDININDSFTRLYIKDNGKGCTKIRDSMGLGGMKERIKNIGGSISISGEDGFLIVCILPKATQNM